MNVSPRRIASIAAARSASISCHPRHPRDRPRLSMCPKPCRIACMAAFRSAHMAIHPTNPRHISRFLKCSSARPIAEPLPGLLTLNSHEPKPTASLRFSMKTSPRRIASIALSLSASISCQPPQPRESPRLSMYDTPRRIAFILMRASFHLSNHVTNPLVQCRCLKWRMDLFILWSRVRSLARAPACQPENPYESRPWTINTMARRTSGSIPARSARKSCQPPKPRDRPRLSMCLTPRLIASILRRFSCHVATQPMNPAECRRLLSWRSARASLDPPSPAPRNRYHVLNPRHNRCLSMKFSERCMRCSVA
eukprot:5864666-Prymnesium_polylepis.1